MTQCGAMPGSVLRQGWNDLDMGLRVTSEHVQRPHKTLLVV